MVSRFRGVCVLVVFVVFVAACTSGGDEPQPTDEPEVEETSVTISTVDVTEADSATYAVAVAADAEISDPPAPVQCALLGGGIIYTAAAALIDEPLSEVEAELTVPKRAYELTSSLLPDAEGIEVLCRAPGASDSEVVDPETGDSLTGADSEPPGFLADDLPAHGPAMQITDASLIRTESGGVSHWDMAFVVGAEGASEGDDVECTATDAEAAELAIDTITLESDSEERDVDFRLEPPERVDQSGWVILSCATDEAQALETIATESAAQEKKAT